MKIEGDCSGERMGSRREVRKRRISGMIYDKLENFKTRHIPIFGKKKCGKTNTTLD